MAYLRGDIWEVSMSIRLTNRYKALRKLESWFSGTPSFLHEIICVNLHTSSEKGAQKHGDIHTAGEKLILMNLLSLHRVFARQMTSERIWFVCSESCHSCSRSHGGYHSNDTAVLIPRGAGRVKVDWDGHLCVLCESLKWLKSGTVVVK